MGNVILTSCHLRHNYFVNVVERICDVSLVIQEDKPGLTGEALHTEKKYFSNGNKILAEVARCEKGRLNSFQITEQIRDQKPDIIFVFGSGIIGSKIIEIPRLGCVNVHTGITQHFRGVDSCFWAVHDDKPQGIGATLHFIDEGIDTGPIIAQRRPILNIEDSLWDIFMKTCLVGFGVLEQNIDRIKNKSIDITPGGNGKVYRMRNMSENVFKLANANLKRVITDYQVMYDKS